MSAPIELLGALSVAFSCLAMGLAIAVIAAALSEDGRLY